MVETNPGAGNEDDVDLGMPKEPKEVLAQQGVAAFGGIEKMRAHRAIDPSRAWRSPP